MRSTIHPVRHPSPRSALLLAAVVFGVTACERPSAKPGDSAPTGARTATPPAGVVTLGARDVATVALHPIAAGITVTGSLDPTRQVEVKAQLAGQLDRVLVERGSVVRRGQVLATFDAGTVRAQTASAEADVASKERDLDAADTLYKRGVISQRDYVQAKVALDAARAQLMQMREMLDRATVRSPVTGQISEKSVASGEAVQVGGKLFTVVNADTLELAAQVAANQIGQVRVGQPVRFTLDAYPDRVLTGRVARMDAVANAGTRQVGVYIRVPNTDHGIVAGLFATGTIVTSGASGATPVPTIPTVAVHQDSGQSVVYTVEGDRVQRRPVTLGARDDVAGLVEVRAGLAPGARVITAPGQGLAVGTPVRLLADVAGARQP